MIVNLVMRQYCKEIYWILPILRNGKLTNAGSDAHLKRNDKKMLDPIRDLCKISVFKNYKYTLIGHGPLEIPLLLKRI